MASFFVDVNQSQAKLTVFRDSNCFIIASTVSAYSLLEMLVRVGAEGSTESLRNAVYDHRSSRLDIAFHAIRAETNRNNR